MLFEDITKIPEEEYVTCQRIVEHCREQGIAYIKTDIIKYGYRDLVSNGGWNGFYNTCDLRNTRTLVTGYSDFPIDGHEYDILEQPTLQKWFANNVGICHSKLVAVPLGLPNEVDFPVYGNTRRLHEVANSAPKNAKKLAYMNFRVETFPSERLPVKEMFSGLPWVTEGYIDWSEEGYRKYLEEIRDHKFCICPRGNGVDTHRTLESIYLGSIPICKRSVALEQFSELPILFIDDWSEITPEYLEKVYEDFSTRDFDIRKILMSYWKKQIVI
jgi:hypothetical protein